MSASTQSVDPTRTTTLRKRYAQKLRGEFADVNTEIRRGVRDRDAFGLRSEALADRVPPFRFDTDDRKVEGFLDWLDRQLRQGVLEVISRGSNTYIRSAYGSGLRQAATELRKRGIDVTEASLEATFNAGVHRDSLELLYTRNYQALQGITDDVSKEIGRELANGFAQGWNPRKTARKLTDRVDSIGKTRATTMARTETINAHAEAALNRYERQGVEQVNGQAEWIATDDRRTCPICRNLDGNVYAIEEARGKIPQHPNCRCSWLPVV